MLGVYLRVPRYILMDIETQYLQSQGSTRCKEEVLHAWLRATPDASWKEVADCLRQIDEQALASRIEDKYCQPSSSQNGDQLNINDTKVDQGHSYHIIECN